ncbi:MAG: PqqD family protein [Prevotella sp.]|jgi:hypothetical protein|nr:PqqD family protein [Prevotella sp.]
MKRKNGFNIRKICGENIIVAEGKENIDFSNVVSMNDTSAFLWDKLEVGKEYTADDLAAFLTEEYDVDEATALNDCQNIIADWVKADIAEA